VSGGGHTELARARSLAVSRETCRLNSPGVRVFNVLPLKGAHRNSSRAPEQPRRKQLDSYHRPPREILPSDQLVLYAIRGWCFIAQCIVSFFYSSRAECVVSLFGVFLGSVNQRDTGEDGSITDR